MSLGVWEPAKSVAVNREKLNAYLAFIEGLDLESLPAGVPETVQKGDGALMKLQATDWQVAEELNDAELEALIRFYTKAEMSISGWDAGQTSPVIYLVKILKKRGSFTAGLKSWIKANTDNRYLPNGAVVL